MPILRTHPAGYLRKTELGIQQGAAPINHTNWELCTVHEERSSECCKPLFCGNEGSNRESVVTSLCDDFRVGMAGSNPVKQTQEDHIEGAAR
jgi:hypothetical protein